MLRAKKKKGGEEAFPKRTDWTSVKKPQKGAAAFRRLTPGEREKIKQFITENPEGIFGDKKEGDYDKKEGVYKKEVSLLDGGDMVIDVLRKSSPDEP
ncbi:MAG: hypothetical protein FJY76_04225, partial [Candidatus Aenigmarchaeota archaeon]|nr:hypothetical protein [Candidatus Aenigmarchaeota archaeon]